MTSPVRVPVPTSLYDENTKEKSPRSSKLRKGDDTSYRRRLIAGEEHWTKVLQVNANGNHQRCVRQRVCSRSPSPRNGGPLPRYPSPSPRHYCPSPSSPLPGRRKRSKSLGRTGEGILHNITKKVRSWIQSKRKYEISPTECIPPPAEDKQVWNHQHQVFNEDISLRSYRSSFQDQQVPNSEVSSVHDSSGAGTPDSRHRTVVQITYSEAQSEACAEDSGVGSVGTPHLLKPPDISGRQLLRASRYKHREKHLLSVCPGGKKLLTGTISCPPEQNSNSGDVSPRFRPRSATWPIQGRKTCSEDGDDVDIAFLRDSVFERSILDGKKSIEDFSIQYEDLNIIGCMRAGRRCTILRGRWHGDVAIHLFGEMKADDTDAFWCHLTKLCRIRHENINLFMGACTVPPNRAVITSAPAGLSLYEKAQKEKLTVHAKIQILRQITVGMGYLHAKDIVLRKLNSKNIFLAPRVKISAMDFAFAESKHDRPGYSCMPRGHVTYLAPELLSSMVSVPPRFVTPATYTFQTDVFAFGTVMYEVLSGQFPYDDLPVESVIWLVCHGRRQCLAGLSCTSAMKELIEDCWAHEPCWRPDFPELSKDLHQNSPLYKRHSSSEPERLHRTSSYMDRLSPF